MKLKIVEFAMDTESEGIFIRDFGKSNVKYDKEKDIYYVEYKNQKVPVKQNYIHNNCFSVLNYENSFIPINIIDFKIMDIDVTGEKNKTLNKLKLQIKNKKIQKIDVPNPNNPDENITIEREIESPKNKILRMCAIPMAIREFYLLDLKRLARKHMSWFQRNITIIMLIMFMCFTVALVYVSYEMGNAHAVQVLKETMNTLNKLQIFAVKNESFVPVEELVTTTTVRQPPSFLP